MKSIRISNIKEYVSTYPDVYSFSLLVAVNGTLQFLSEFDDPKKHFLDFSDK